jgi:hypothetical protein
MHPLRSALFTVFVGATGILMLAPNSLAETEVFHVRGHNLFAGFVSNEGCISTNVSLFAAAESFHNPPGPAEPSWLLSIDIFQLDTCAFQTLVSASGNTTTSAEIEVKGGTSLSSATLSATIPVFDSVSQSSFDVSLDLLWTGTGELFYGNTHGFNRFPTSMNAFHSVGSQRDAQVSGTVSASGTNFTPTPSIFGLMVFSRQGSTIIFH